MITGMVKLKCDNCSEVSEICRTVKETGFTTIQMSVERTPESYPVDVRVELCPNCFTMSNLKSIALARLEGKA